MSENANHLRIMISDFDAVRLYAMTGGEEISRALRAACELIEDLQARVTKLEAQVMDADRLPVDITDNLAEGTATDDGMPRYADPADADEQDDELYHAN